MKKVNVYAHTHWDYEWYFTNNESTVQLIYHMDEVIDALESNVLDYYHLDGQISIIETYLELVPTNKERIKHLIKNDKLIIGPWYTQTDALMISGESIIRNLYYGIKQDIGKVMKVGYLPDTFGFNQDMPKIYQGFDIQYALFWRGLSTEDVKSREFKWLSKDQSEVICYHIKDGYYYGGNLIYNDNIKQVEEIFLKDTSLNDVLVPVGGDQRYVDFDLKERLNYYQENTYHQLKYKEISLENFFNLIKNRVTLTYQGEIINPSVSKIHRSIYSSRYDIKQLNDQLERMMIYHLEPLLVMLQGMGITPKLKLLEQSWKEVLLSQAHDSIGGCNSDKTNQNILNRQMQAKQLIQSNIEYLVRKVGETILDINQILLVHTGFNTKKQIYELEVSTRKPNFEIRLAGQKIPYQVINKQREYRGSIRKHLADYDENAFYYQTKICIQQSLNPLSYQVIDVIELDDTTISPFKCDTHIIENEYYKITKDEKGIHLFDKEKQLLIENWIGLIDEADDGDLYDYSPHENSTCVIHELDDTVCYVQKGIIFEQMRLEGSIYLPTSIKSTTNKLIENPFHIEIRLSKSKLIQFVIDFDNRVTDHRLRIMAKSGLKSNQSFADSTFSIVERENNPNHIHDWRSLNWKEEPSPIYPLLHFAGIKKEKLAFIAYTKCVKEYEVIDDTMIALTLFRSVQYLGKPELVRRPGIASGNEFKYIETPDGQLLKELHFEFAFAFQENNPVVWMKSYQDYVTEPLYYQKQDLNRFTNPMKYFVIHPLKKVDLRMLNFDLLDSELIVSSLQPLEDDQFTIRFLQFNLSNIEQKIQIQAKALNLVSFEHTIRDKVKQDQNVINLGEFKETEIKTLMGRWLNAGEIY